MDSDRRVGDRRRTAPDLAAAVALLDEHVTTMTAEAAMLRHEVSQQKVRSTVIGFILGGVILFGAILLTIAAANRATLNRVDLTQDYLVECTTPGPRTPTAEDPSTGHPCFDDGQRRTAEVVERIIEGVRAP